MKHKESCLRYVGCNCTEGSSQVYETIETLRELCAIGFEDVSIHHREEKLLSDSDLQTDSKSKEKRNCLAL